MKFENEVTVEVNYSKDELYSILEKNDFKIYEEYDVNDIYMYDKKYENIDNVLELLNHCILIRKIISSEAVNVITYKYKEYNENEEIVKDGKINVEIKNIEDAIELFKCLGYEHLIDIRDHIVVFNNGIDELAIEFVNGKHIYIEIENKCNYSDKIYSSTNEMKNMLKKYNIDEIKNNNFYAKKAKDAILERKSDN